jgi:fructose transport system substrate-binding protein
VIGATAQQYPLQMASLGMEAILEWAENGTKPEPTEGKDFFDTGVSLVTGDPVKEVESISVSEGMDRCWG